MDGGLSTVHFVIIIIVIILVGWLAMRIFYRPPVIYTLPPVANPPTLAPSLAPMVEPMGPMESPAAQTVLYNFYSPECPHCRKFAPIWEEVTGRLPQNLSVRAIDVTNPDNENIVFYYNITQLPTVILAMSDRNIEYKGDRSATDLYNFIMGHISN